MAGTNLTLLASSIVGVPTTQEAVVGTVDVVVVQSFDEDGESGKENEGREELHDGGL